MSSKICNFYNCDNTSVNNWIIFIAVFSRSFGFGIFANDNFADNLVKKFAPSHPSLERREKALNLFTKE